MATKTTLVINFEAGTDADLTAVAQLDDELNKDASGDTKSQFANTDKPYFLVHIDPKLQVTEVRCSSGSARHLGVVTRTATVDNLDVDESGDTVELNYIPASNPAYSWYGNSPAVARSGKTLTFTGALPATGKATYTYKAHSYQYIPPQLGATQEWRTRIVIKVEATK